MTQIAHNYYNTLGKVGQALKDKIEQSKGSPREVLEVFAYNAGCEFTAWEVFAKIPRKGKCINSVRRAITDLVKSNHLQYTGKTRVSGPWKEECRLIKM